ncbi:MAG: alpha/beta hydrolase, partial [Anaerolineales bacterium]|nr:alpha/beta hydrolase [Anaerolineales bacterium]
NSTWIDLSTPVPQAKTDHITRQFRDLPYGEHPLQKLDVYLPEQGDGPFPVIVNVHGGGFMACDKHDFHLYPTMFALDQGFAVVAVNYRLSPSVRYPEHVYDIERALLWISKNGLEKKLDPDKICLWGTSAGGNIVLQAACRKGLPLPDDLQAAKKIPIRAVAALCPGIDLIEYGHVGTLFERLLVRYLFRNLHKDVFGTRRVPEATARLSNPTTYIGNGIAPVYLQQGTKDPAVAYPVVKAFGDCLADILPPEDFIFDVLEGAPHAGADETYFLQKNVDPILRFFERHLPI